MTTPGGPAPSRHGEPGVARPAAGSTAVGGSAPGGTEVQPDRAPGRLPVGLSVLGGSLVLATILVAGTLVENRPRDFNWSAFLVALVGTVLLLAAAAAVALLGRGLRSGLPAVLGSFGLIGVAVLWLSWLQPRYEHWPVYVAGVFLVVAGVLGWWLLRGSALLLVAGLGGMLLLGQAATDITDGSAAQDARGPALWVGLAFALFGVAFAAGLWWLPSRHVTGLAGTALALASMATAVYVMVLVGAFDAMPTFEDGEAATPDVDVSWYAVTAMVIGLLLCAAAVAVWALTGHLGYVVLGVVGVLTMATAGVAAAAPDATLRWATGLGVLGAAALAAGTVPGLLRRRRGAA